MLLPIQNTQKNNEVVICNDHIFDTEACILLILKSNMLKLRSCYVYGTLATNIKNLFVSTFNIINKQPSSVGSYKTKQAMQTKPM